jgi:hypothetical protein
MTAAVQLPRVGATRHKSRSHRGANWLSLWKTILAELLCRTTADVN